MQFVGWVSHFLISKILLGLGASLIVEKSHTLHCLYECIVYDPIEDYRLGHFLQWHFNNHLYQHIIMTCEHKEMHYSSALRVFHKLRIWIPNSLTSNHWSYTVFPTIQSYQILHMA